MNKAMSRVIYASVEPEYTVAVISCTAEVKGWLSFTRFVFLVVCDIYFHFRTCVTSGSNNKQLQTKSVEAFKTCLEPEQPGCQKSTRLWLYAATLTRFLNLVEIKSLAFHEGKAYISIHPSSFVQKFYKQIIMEWQKICSIFGQTLKTTISHFKFAGGQSVIGTTISYYHLGLGN